MVSRPRDLADRMAARRKSADGYLRVDYDVLGLKFLTWDEWVARRSTQSRTMQ